MQNLDWNKCFQRVSDAGLHFPLLFPSSGWHVFVFPLVRPPRTPGEACPPALSFPGLMRLAEVDEGPISISNTSVGEEALPTDGWIHALHLMRFICMEREKETMCQRGHVPLRLL